MQTQVSKPRFRCVRPCPQSESTQGTAPRGRHHARLSPEPFWTKTTQTKPLFTPRICSFTVGGPDPLVLTQNPLRSLLGRTDQAHRGTTERIFWEFKTLPSWVGVAYYYEDDDDDYYYYSYCKGGLILKEAANCAAPRPVLYLSIDVSLFFCWKQARSNRTLHTRLK